MIGEEEKIALLVVELEDIRCDFYADTDEDKTLKEAIRLIKASKQQSETGHWIRVTDKTGHFVWECDRCGWQQRFNTNYCPDCGQPKMQEVDE